MSTLVKKIVAEKEENTVLAKVFVMDMDGDEIFDFKGCMKTLHDNDIGWEQAMNRAEQIQKIFYRNKEEGL